MIASVFFSGFQVKYPLDGQIVIINPPSLWIAFVCYTVAVLGLLAFAGSLSTKNRTMLVLGAVLLVGGVFTGWRSSMSSSVTIDKRVGTITFHTGWPGDYVLPLGELKYATVETDNAAYRLVFVMEGGHRESLGAYSDQSGQPEAAYAINQFLGVEAKP